MRCYTLPDFEHLRSVRRHNVALDDTLRLEELVRSVDDGADNWTGLTVSIWRGSHCTSVPSRATWRCWVYRRRIGRENRGCNRATRPRRPDCWRRHERYRRGRQPDVQRDAQYRRGGTLKARTRRALAELRAHGHLRSPKTLTGPALGVPSLTFRAWYEAKYGLNAGKRFTRHKRTWVEYLPAAENAGFAGQPWRCAGNARTCRHFIQAVLNENGARRSVMTRRVVLATGRAGAGGDFWPDFVDPESSPILPPIPMMTSISARFTVSRSQCSAAAHPHGTMQPQRLNAARRRGHVCAPSLLATGQQGAWLGISRLLHGWSSLPDAERWATMVYLNDLQSPVPHETVNRTTRLGGFHIHFRAGIETASRADEKVAVKIAGQDETRMHDFLIVGTGFNVDPALIPELASYAPNIATWYDRYQPAPDLRRRDLERFPYLGPGFELTEKRRQRTNTGPDPSGQFRRPCKPYRDRQRYPGRQYRSRAGGRCDRDLAIPRRYRSHAPQGRSLQRAGTCRHPLFVPE